MTIRLLNTLPSQPAARTHVVRFGADQPDQPDPINPADTPGDQVQIGSTPPRVSLNGGAVIRQAVAELAKTDPAKAQQITQQYDALKQQFGADAIMTLQIGTVEAGLESSGVPSFLASVPVGLLKEEFVQFGFDRQQMDQAHQVFNRTDGKKQYADLMEQWKALTKHLLFQFVENKHGNAGVDTVRGEDALADSIARIAQVDAKEGRILQGLWDDAKGYAGDDATLMIYMAGMYRRVQGLPYNFILKKLAWHHTKNETAGLGFGDQRVDQVIDLYSQLGGDHKYARLADLYFRLSEEQLAKMAKTP